MAFDFKKEYKELYLPKSIPVIVNIPRMNFVAVRGMGDPNEEGGAYQQAIGILYGISYCTHNPSSIIKNSAAEQSIFFFLPASCTAHSKSVFETKSGSRIIDIQLKPDLSE